MSNFVSKAHYNNTFLEKDIQLVKTAYSGTRILLLLSVFLIKIKIIKSGTRYLMEKPSLKRGTNKSGIYHSIEKHISYGHFIGRM